MACSAKAELLQNIHLGRKKNSLSKIKTAIFAYGQRKARDFLHCKSKSEP